MPDGVFTHTSLSPGQDMPGGGKWHTVWAKADDHASNGSAKAANHRGVAVMLSPSQVSWRTAPWRAPFFLRFDYLVNEV